MYSNGMFLKLLDTLLSFFQRIKFKFGMDRKTFVLRHIKRHKCTSILEIGVFNGNFANRMLKTALESSFDSRIVYVGVDLFESNFTPEIKVKEVAVTPKTVEYVRNLLDIPRVDVNLYEGWSFEILPKLAQKFDLIVIDGGHSYETVSSDLSNAYKLLRGDGTIILDDFTNGKGVEFGGFGINQVVSEIDKSKYHVKLGINRDFFVKSYGILILRMVKVQPKLRNI